MTIFATRSNRLILCNGQTFELKSFNGDQKHYFTRFEKINELILVESDKKAHVKQIHCYSTTSAKLLWIVEIHNPRPKRIFDLFRYRDILILQGESPQHITPEYIPQSFYVISDSGKVLWSSESINRSDLPREEINDWVLGLAKDRIAVRQGKIVAHWASMAPDLFGMTVTPTVIFDVRTGNVLRIIRNSIRPIMVDDKIIYLARDHQDFRIVIEDIENGELLSVCGDSCHAVKGYFIITKANDILAYH